MLVCGIDVATHLGMALVGGEEDRTKSIHVNQTGMGRVQSIASAVDQTLAIWKPFLVVLESYAFSPNMGSVITIVEITTAIKLVLKQRKIKWLEVKPTTLKKWTTEHGDADKPMMARVAEKRWGFKNINHDIVDAFCLAKFGEQGITEALCYPGVELGS